MTGDLPPFLRDLLAAPPRAGEGVHAWLFRVARQLHAHLPAGEIVNVLQTGTANCGRPVPRAEIVSAVRDSIGCAWQPRGHTKLVQLASKWPVVNQERREAIIAGGGLADLWEGSPVRLEDNARRTEEIIDRLFPGNPLLCCGHSQSNFDTRSRESWRGEMADLQFIVPSPMTAVTGKAKSDGHDSKHTLANTGPRRFLVAEFDTGTTDQHAALLLHLATYAPLVCVVHSGGKSLHGWFYVEAQPEGKVLKFFQYAVSLGADPMTWTTSQFVRMPDGTRDNGRRQAVYFLNFNPVDAKR